MIDETEIVAHKLAVVQQCEKLNENDVELVPKLIDIFVCYVIPVLNVTNPGDKLFVQTKDLQNCFWQKVEGLKATSVLSAVLAAMGMRNFK